MIKKILAVIVGALLGLAFVGAAYAWGGSNPPLEYIRYQGKNVQKTVLYHYDWHYRTINGQWNHNTWTAPTYEWPGVTQTPPETRVNVVIRSPRKPDKFNIRNYQPIDRNSPPKGGEPIPAHLYPIRNKDDQIIKWGAWFELQQKNANRHHNLVIRTKWLPDPGTSHSYGTEVRLAHLRAK